MPELFSHALILWLILADEQAISSGHQSASARHHCEKKEKETIRKTSMKKGVSDDRI
jgi:hypothetical protein